MNHITERRQEERERRRAEILDAAIAVAGSAGIDAMTMDEVARKARLSRALLYVYFGDKSDLIFGLCERALTLLGQRFLEAVARHKRGLDQLEAIGRAYIAFSQEFPVYFDVMARCELLTPEPADEAANESACLRAGDRLHAIMIEALHKGITDGSVRADVGDPQAVAVALWGFMHGVIQLSATKANVLTHRGVSSKALVEQALAMVGRALAQPD
jgi:AcrR family transcriptional regulator